MAHKRKDTFCKTRGWCRHLRPFGKRDQNGRERLTARRQIAKDAVEE